MPERIPPHDLDAERALLGSMLLSRDAIDEAAALRPGDFYKPAHATLFHAIRDLAAHGTPVDVITVADAWPDGTKDDLHALAGATPASAHASAYCRIIAETAQHRRMIALAGEISERSYRSEPVGPMLLEVQELAAPNGHGDYRPGGGWIFADHQQVPALWGEDEQILWARGEPFYLVGPTGVGKTTLTQQLVAGLVGLRSEVLGLPVELANRVLYLACDRPSQIKRAFRRLFTSEQVDVLDEALVLWEGALPDDLARSPETLLSMARAAEADVVIVDSIKDVVTDINEPAQGQAFNRSVQLCVAAGVDVLGLHHTRKKQAGASRLTIDDVYGGWFAAGAGSIVLLSGEPGDPVVSFRHVKQPLEEVGPWQIVHDHTRGESKVERGPIDVVAVLARQAGGRTAAQLAQLNAEGAEPSAVQIRKMERRLEGLVKRGKVVRLEGEPPTYGATAR